MKKNQSGSAMVVITVVIAVVVVAALAVAAWFAFTQNKTDDANGNGDGTSDQMEAEPVAIQGTMFEATKHGSPLECDWKLDYEGKALVSEGKFYTNGTDKSRSTANFTTAEGTYETNTIIDGDKIYDWDDLSEYLFVTNRAGYEGQPPQEVAYGTSTQPDLNANFNFDCKAWAVDESMFTPPADRPTQGA